ncbi:hypothetical protein TTHT_1608 [Thermotomaculum hydrothermale]|uniref:Lipoprotein n=1 Tax=Thermotomaculum hydrothermale TaxID=981385 RepID=A0A7R6PPU5_9BACT|nr:hypothetical protein [Thermotomaculum hydrothermale]BBB33096.1 hypothetical protein TTHT_1608 [Thermotomaculum hydrothermale]
MKKLLIIFVLTILFISCGYKVNTYPQHTFILKAFNFNDPLLLQFKKDIEWKIKDNLYLSGYTESKDANPDFQVYLNVNNFKSFTVQSGSDNRQTAKELRYKVECTFIRNGKTFVFKDTIKLYQKFPVKSKYFVDKRKELAGQLAEEIALRVNSWITKIM